MNAWEKAVLQHILADTDEARETCREWLDQSSSRDEAELGLARQLEEDLRAELMYSNVDDPLDPDRPLHVLHNKLIHHALASVNWLRVAKSLFDRYFPKERHRAIVALPSRN